MLNLNRRIRNRTYGGVRGRGRKLPLLLDVRQAWREATWRAPCRLQPGSESEPGSDLEDEMFLYGP
jgi:hypothetical protein